MLVLFQVETLMSMSKELHTSIRIVDCCNFAGKPHLSLFHKFGGSTTKIQTYNESRSESRTSLLFCQKLNSYSVAEKQLCKHALVLQQSPARTNVILKNRKLSANVPTAAKLRFLYSKCKYFQMHCMQDGTVTIGLQWCTILEPLRFSWGQMYSNKMRANFRMCNISLSP